MKLPRKPQARRAASLFAPKQRGGVIGGAGYNFQDAYIVTALPAWLSDPTFRSFIKEGFEDVDVKFEGSQGTRTWHYQLKDHSVTAPEFRGVLEGFASVAGRSDPNATRLILGCTGLAPNLDSLTKLIEEFRGARKIHSEAALLATKKHLQNVIVTLRLAEWADLIIDRIEIDHENPGLRDTEPTVLMERFRGAFILLPLYRGEGHEVLDRLFERLMVRVNKAIRVGVSRDELEATVRGELAAAVKGKAIVIHLHGWTRQAYDLAADEEIDWTQHFDHATLRVPTVEVWERELLPNLRALRDRFDRDGNRRMIWLRARAPLSVGLAFGHAFAEAAGYRLRIQQPSPGAAESIQHWETDAQAESAYQIGCDEVDGDPAGDDLVVGIGVTDDPRPKVEHYLPQTDLKVRAAVYLRPSGGASATSIDAKTVGTFASAVKREIRRACNRYSPRVIRLFYFGPLGLAVLLGQKLNGLADIQCYERSKTAGYTPSCRLPA